MRCSPRFGVVTVVQLKIKVFRIVTLSKDHIAFLFRTQQSEIKRLRFLQTAVTPYQLTRRTNPEILSLFNHVRASKVKFSRLGERAQDKWFSEKQEPSAYFLALRILNH
jgi:hypothetical protein